MTHKELLLKALNERPKTPQEAIREVVNVLDDTSFDSIRRRLNELREAGKVVVVGEKADQPVLTVATSPMDDVIKLERKHAQLSSDHLKLKKKYSKAIQYRNLEEAMIGAYAEFGTRCDPVTPIAPTYPDLDLTDRIPETSLSLLGDWHFWEVVDKRATGGLAEYNMDVATGYMDYLAKKTIHLIKNVQRGHVYRDHYVFMLGDFVSTNIHEVMSNSPGTAVDSLLQGQLLLAWYLLDLARYFENVNVCCVVGNHGRLAQKKNYKQRFANLDFVLYNQLAIMLAGQKNIHFQIPLSFFELVEIEGHSFLILHGDDIKSWNQIPWYGIDRAVSKFRELLHAHGKSFDNVIMGHFHNSGDIEMPSGEKVINGSAIGATDFSMGALFTGNRPHQWVYSVHKEHGLSWRYPVMLKVPDQEDRRYALEDDVAIHEQWSAILDGYLVSEHPLYNDYKGGGN